MRMSSLGMRNSFDGGFDSGEGTIPIHRHYYDDYTMQALSMGAVASTMWREPGVGSRAKDSAAIKAAKKKRNKAAKAAKRNNRIKKGK